MSVKYVTSHPATPAPGEKIATNCGNNNAPLRGSKMTYWEGGVRGIGLISGPVLPARIRGARWNGMMSQTDWFPTLLKLAGLTESQISDSGPVALDGMDIWAAITSLGTSPRTELVHNINQDKPGSIRVGKYVRAQAKFTSHTSECKRNLSRPL
jgi:arylsulfatase I/J